MKQLYIQLSREILHICHLPLINIIHHVYQSLGNAFIIFVKLIKYM